MAEIRSDEEKNLAYYHKQMLQLQEEADKLMEYTKELDGHYDTIIKSLNELDERIDALSIQMEETGVI